jgi:hypothetical protein
MSSCDDDWPEPWRGGGVERRPQAVWWLLGALVVLGSVVAVTRMRSAAPDLAYLPDRQFDAVVPADQKQFFLLDSLSLADPDAGESVVGEEVDDWVAVNNRVLRVGTVRSTGVPVSVRLLAQAPDETFDGWDHVVDCSLRAPSGKLVLVDGRGRLTAPVRLPRGSYRVRVCVGGLDRAGADHYVLLLWPAPLNEPRILKSDGEPRERKNRMRTLEQP